MVAIGDRVKMDQRGARWAFSKKGRTMGINWETREGVVTHLPHVDKTIAMVIWDGNKALKPIPLAFLVKVS